MSRILQTLPGSNISQISISPLLIVQHAASQGTILILEDKCMWHISAILKIETPHLSYVLLSRFSIVQILDAKRYVFYLFSNFPLSIRVNYFQLSFDYKIYIFLTVKS